MGLIKGGIHLLETILYALAFCCAAIILGIYSYFLSLLADRNVHIPTWEKAVEGLSGGAVVYLIFATTLTCCFGGISFLAFVAIVLDILFCGAMITTAVLTRHGASSCKGYVRTPLGNGDASSGTSGFDSDIVYSVKYGTACTYNTAVFSVAVIGAFIFLCTAIMQLALVRKHKKEKRFGPSPDNNYTGGSGNKNKKDAERHATFDVDTTAHGTPYTEPVYTTGTATNY